jgi:probable O-glycosylation ligase (exosortase A-associated)
MKTVILWVACYFGLLAASFFGPMFALLAYLLDYYQHPDIRWWGQYLPDLRWSLVSSCVLLGSYLINHGSIVRPVARYAQTWWLVALLVFAALSTPLAVDYTRSWEELLSLGKLVLLYALIAGTIRTRQHFNWFVTAMILGGFLWGFDAYLDPDRIAGRLRRIGGPDSYNDNSAAAHLLTTLPFLGVALWVGKRWQKALAIAAAPFILNTIVLCNSRGATLGIGVSGLAAIMLVPRRYRLRIGAAVVAGGLLFMHLTDDTFVDRQLTLLSEERDSSSQGRIDTWRGALELVEDHPFGTGGGGFDALSPKYIPEIVDAYGGEPRTVHNTYLLVATDWGIQGFVCFVGFILATIVSLHRIRRDTTDLSIALQAFAIESALLGFLMAAMFINRPYAEVLYWLAGMTAALRNIQKAEATATVPQEDAAGPDPSPVTPPPLRPVPLYGGTSQRGRL